MTNKLVYVYENGDVESTPAISGPMSLEDAQRLQAETLAKHPKAVVQIRDAHGTAAATPNPIASS
jgi:hypothetical protein